MIPEQCRETRPTDRWNYSWFRGSTRAAERGTARRRGAGAQAQLVGNAKRDLISLIFLHPQEYDAGLSCRVRVFDLEFDSSQYLWNHATLTNGNSIINQAEI